MRHILLLLIILIFIIIIFIIKNSKNKKDIPKFKEDGDEYFINGDYDLAMDNYNKVFIYDPYNEEIPEVRKNINEIIKNNEKYIQSQTIINDENDNINDINDYIILYTAIIDNDLGDDIVFDNLEDNTVINNNLYNNDTQNVHDSVVNKTINKSIDKLSKNTIQNNPINEINKYLLENMKNHNLSDDDKAKITETIKYIEKNSNAKINDKYLKDNLILVGNRIMNNTNNEEKKNMEYNLYRELVDCVKSDNSMYCLTGISNRIINSLNGVDSDVNVIPKWALREEMMRKCGEIRNNFDDKGDIDLKDEITKKLKEEYVDTNILDEVDFYNEINEWIEYV